MENLSFLSGKPFPYGVSVFGNGVNFSLFSRHASSVTLELFEKSDDATPVHSYTFDTTLNKTGDIWHVFKKSSCRYAVSIPC